MQRELPQQIYEIRDLILQSVEAERIYLFGSYAYGIPNEDSDYDFYVVLPDGYPLRRSEAIDRIRLKIAHTPMMKPYDILVNYKTRFEALSVQPTILKEIAETGIVLYDRQHRTEFVA